MVNGRHNSGVQHNKVHPIICMITINFTLAERILDGIMVKATVVLTTDRIVLPVMV